MTDRLVIRVMAQEGSIQHVQEKEITFDDLRKIPNPRQALVAHFLYMTREVIADADPSVRV